jgi:hypothetical protein
MMLSGKPATVDKSAQAKMLFEHGADINFNPFHNDSTPLAIARNFDWRREALVDWLKENGAQSKEAVIV